MEKLNKTKLVAFLACSLSPAIYLIIRFNLFEKKNMVEMNLWLVLAVIVFASVLSVIIYYCVSAIKTRYFWWKQLLVGFVKVILPLIVLLAVTTWLSNNISLFKEFIIVTICFESLAIIINPFPKWCFDNNVDGLAEITDKLFHRDVKEESEQ